MIKNSCATSLDHTHVSYDLSQRFLSVYVCMFNVLQTPTQYSNDSILNKPRINLKQVQSNMKSSPTPVISKQVQGTKSCITKE